MDSLSPAVTSVLSNTPYFPQVSPISPISPQANDGAFEPYGNMNAHYSDEANYMLSPLQTQNISTQTSFPELCASHPQFSTSSMSFLPSALTPLTCPFEMDPFYLNDAASTSGGSSSPGSDTSSPLSPTVTIERPLSVSTSSAERRASFSSSNGDRGRSNHSAGHPYHRSEIRKANHPELKKRNSRRIWTHALEKYVFSPHEIASLGITHRRTIYSASLEAHIDRLHCQLLAMNLFPIHVDELQPYKGLNCKIAKALLAGLQHDYVQVRTGLLEIERATENAYAFLAQTQSDDAL